MKAWYYLVKGRPHGPVTASAIEHEIKSGQLLPRDLIYRERDTVWREIGSFAEFSHLFKAKAASENVKGAVGTPVAEALNQWVLLVRKPDGSGYKQKGPFTTQDIAKLLHEEEILQTDYVWREGLKEWYKILAVGEIQEAVADLGGETASGLNLSAMPPPPPPLTITRSAVTDDEAVPPKLNPVKPNQPKAKAVPTAPVERVVARDDRKGDRRDSLDEAADIFDAKTVIRPRPSVATNDDLTQTELGPVDFGKASEAAERPVKPADRKNREVRPGKKRPEKVEAKGTRITLFRYFVELTPVGKGIFALTIMGLVALGVYGSFWMTSYQDRLNTKLKTPNLAELPPLPVEKSPAPPAATPAVPTPSQNNQGGFVGGVNPPAVNNPPTGGAPVVPSATSPVTPIAVGSAANPPGQQVVAPEVKRAPTRIQVERLGSGSENFSLKVVSDGSSHYPIVLTLESVVGQVLDSPSVYTRKVLRTLADRLVDFKKMRLPLGEYHVLIESENVKTATTADFGTQSKDFRARIGGQRKRLSYDHNQERHNLVKVAGRVETEAYKFAQNLDSAGELRSWNEFYRSWRRGYDRIQNSYLSEVSSRNRQKYVHGGLWLQLKDARAQVDKEAKAAHKARSEGRPASSAIMRALAQNISQIKEQAVQANLWK